EIPALHSRLALTEYFFRHKTHRDGRHSRWRAKGLLRSAETNIDSLAVHVQRHGRERSYRIHHQQRAQLVRHLANRTVLREHTRWRFTLREPNHVDLFDRIRPAHI